MNDLIKQTEALASIESALTIARVLRSTAPLFDDDLLMSAAALLDADEPPAEWVAMLAVFHGERAAARRSGTRRADHRTNVACVLDLQRRELDPVPPHRWLARRRFRRVAGEVDAYLGWWLADQVSVAASSALGPSCVASSSWPPRRRCPVRPSAAPPRSGPPQ
jgi:hypothetical protein